jgi:hypothetical protein
MIRKACIDCNAADCAGASRELVARPRDSLAAQVLAHRIAEPFTKQLREMHWVHFRDPRDICERRRPVMPRSQVVSTAIESVMLLECATLM